MNKEYLLELGTSQVDITPPYPVMLAGFACRKGNFTGISHPLRLKTFYFSRKISGHQAVMIIADLLWWGTDTVIRLKEEIEQQFGIKSEEIMFHATHNHSGPQCSELFTPSLGLADVGYLDFLVDRVLNGIQEAKDNLEPISVERGSTCVAMGINRRKMVDGQMKMAPNEAGSCDDEVIVVRYFTTNGTKAIMVHYNCHATTTADNQISDEFPGAAMRKVEEKLGGNVTAAYLQGCCADVRPNLVRDGEFYRGSDAEVAANGELLAKAVLAVLKKPMRHVTLGPLCVREKTVYLSVQSIPDPEVLQKHLNCEGVMGEWSRLLTDHPERLKPVLPLTLSLLQLSRELSFLGLSGEIVADYGIELKAKYGRTVLPLGYTNGMLGYVPTASQIPEGGYEVREAPYYFGAPGSFCSSVEKVLWEGIKGLLQQIRKEE